MPDVFELPDLAGDVRDRAVPPPYDEVVRRRRAGRIRLAAGTALVCAVVAGGIVAVQVATAPEAASPPAAEGGGPDGPTDPGVWSRVVNGPQAHPFEVSASDDGAVAVVWRSLTLPAPLYALVIRDGSGSVHGTMLEEPVTLTPVPGGWVAVSGYRGWLLGTDGTWRDLGEPDPAREPVPGDVLVAGQYSRWLFDPAAGTWSGSTHDRDSAAGAYVNPEGGLVTCARDSGTIRVAPPDARDQPPSLDGATCLMYGSGDSVVVAGVGDGPDGSLPLTGLLRSTDGGAAWSPIKGVPHDVPLHSLAITTSGTIVLSGDDGRSFVIDRDGTVTHPDTDTGFLISGGGERIYALAQESPVQALLFSDDQGETWQETVIPGMESSAE